jgi:hypothetical protein
MRLWMYHYKTNRFHQMNHQEQQIQSDKKSYLPLPNAKSSEGPRQRRPGYNRIVTRSVQNTGSGMEREKGSAEISVHIAVQPNLFGNC